MVGKQKEESLKLLGLYIVCICIELAQARCKNDDIYLNKLSENVWFLHMETCPIGYSEERHSGFDSSHETTVHFGHLRNSGVVSTGHVSRIWADLPKQRGARMKAEESPLSSDINISAAGKAFSKSSAGDFLKRTSIRGKKRNCMHY